MSDSTERILDLEGLFHYSGMLDSLRDTAKVFVRSGSSANGATPKMVVQYNALRERLRSVMSGAAADQIDVWTSELPRSASIDELYFAAAALARWSDLMHQTPQFLLGQQITAANASEAQRRIAETMGQAGDAVPPGAKLPSVPGQYI